ncbi:gas vesicle protein GvpJ [Nonomuraea dietziae]|uniref:gas vesicle protein GvpJ n=1 Tax=Nonomuraea dietziae TaxID=65515 RepID=UPI003F4CC19D
MTVQPAGGGAAERRTGSGLADVIDSILDKGLVIDAYVGISLVGIELLSIDARITVASVDTYLRFAEAVNRLDLSDKSKPGLPELVQSVKGGDQTPPEPPEPQKLQKPKTVIQGALESAGEVLGDLTDERDDGRRKKLRRTERPEEG